MGVDKSAQMCAWVIKAGKCANASESGKACGFAHPPSSDLKKIACKVGRGKHTPMFCKNGQSCLYNHKLIATPKSPPGQTSVYLYTVIQVDRRNNSRPSPRAQLRRFCGQFQSNLSDAHISVSHRSTTSRSFEYQAFT